MIGLADILVFCRNLSRFLEIKLVGNAVKAGPLGYNHGAYTGEANDEKIADAEEKIDWQPEKDYTDLIVSKYTSSYASLYSCHESSNPHAIALPDLDNAWQLYGCRICKNTKAVISK